MPERTIQTGIGPVEVRQPRVRDRGAADAEHIRFSSAILPPYARRTKSLDVLLPVLYLRGISTANVYRDGGKAPAPGVEAPYQVSSMTRAEGAIHPITIDHMSMLSV